MAADHNTFFNLTLAKTSQGKVSIQQWQRAGICGPILLACFPCAGMRERAGE